MSYSPARHLIWLILLFLCESVYAEPRHITVIVHASAPFSYKQRDCIMTADTSFNKSVSLAFTAQGCIKAGKACGGHTYCCRQTHFITSAITSKNGVMRKYTFPQATTDRHIHVCLNNNCGHSLAETKVNSHTYRIEITRCDKDPDSLIEEAYFVDFNSSPG